MTASIHWHSTALHGCCIHLHIGIHGFSMVQFHIFRHMSVHALRKKVMASVQLLVGVVMQDSHMLALRDGESPCHAGAWRCGSQTG